jgi:hypothetical protein
MKYIKRDHWRYASITNSEKLRNVEEIVSTLILMSFALTLKFNFSKISIAKVIIRRMK